MSSRITINEAKVNSTYERIMDEIYAMFHYHPLNGIPSGRATEEEVTETNFNNAAARYFSEHPGSENVVRSVNPLWRNLPGPGGRR